MNDDQALRDFVAKYARPYDPESDDYDRPPFAADIKEGKNDPIYNAHSYHTKVPPRGIIPYILHYTKPGDLILDPFCGSDMTGVAAQMCANPPAVLLEQFPELKDRVGPRACILNDLTPAACHIAYNYNTPVDVEPLRCEFERIRAAVKDEFNWLYGTEHYEPAVGLYDPASPDVGSRLKNPPGSSAMYTLLGGEERIWELLTRDEVEARLGYPVTELPRDEKWSDLDVAKVNQWVYIPATIQYTVWSDVYGCEGFVTVEEPTGKISKRGRNSGKLIVHKRRVLRGCRKEINLWDTAVNRETGKVADIFVCPHCGQPWKKLQLTRISEVPVETLYAYRPLPRPDGSSRLKRHQRRLTLREAARIQEIESASIPYWYPDDAIDMGREMLQHGLQKRGSMSVSDFFFKRQLWALGRLWMEGICS